MKYVIDYPPVPWARAGISRSQKVFYDRQKKYKEFYAYFLRSQHKDNPFFSGSLKLSITFFMLLPDTPILRKKREKQYYHNSKPDLSNLIKFLEDAAMGIIFADDCIISCIEAQKVYGSPARTEFEVIKL